MAAVVGRTCIRPTSPTVPTASDCTRFPLARPHRLLPAEGRAAELRVERAAVVCGGRSGAASVGRSIPRRGEEVVELGSPTVAPLRRAWALEGMPRAPTTGTAFESNPAPLRPPTPAVDLYARG